MAKKASIDPKIVKNNLESLHKLMAQNDLDGFYISSYDPYLNEYVPMDNCHRFHFTNFSGSVAEALVTKNGKIRLYVDGRYYEQADLEVDASIVEVVKVPSGLSLTENLLKDIRDLEIKKLGFESKRTSFGLYKVFERMAHVYPFADEVEELITKNTAKDLNEIEIVGRELAGLTVSEKLQMIIKDKKKAYFVTAIDSLAWITNCRGYHLANQSAFLGRGLVTHDKVFVFIDETTPVSEKALKESALEFIKLDSSKLAEKLLALNEKYQLKTVYFDPAMLNHQDSVLLDRIFGEEVLEEKAGGLVQFHSIKNETELATMRAGFNLGDQAIYNTIKWAKDSMKEGKNISELDLYKQTTIEYEKLGSREQSFNTIAGCGPNGSIIHYGDPKDSVKISQDDMVLLDSGGYFEGGFATDTTRTFMANYNSKASAKHKEIYTLVLKSLLGLQYAVFPEGTKGIELDAITRNPLWQKGYNFNHGTGHGVGINVHEGGVRISPLSNLPMKENQVVSLEPGIYIPGFGGVRLENIAIVKRHPEFKGMLHFENLVYIGFDPLLIEESMLSANEKEWLADYEKECAKRKRSFHV